MSARRDLVLSLPLTEDEHAMIAPLLRGVRAGERSERARMLRAFADLYDGALPLFSLPVPVRLAAEAVARAVIEWERACQPRDPDPSRPVRMNAAELRVCEAKADLQRAAYELVIAENIDPCAGYVGERRAVAWCERCALPRGAHPETEPLDDDEAQP